MNYPHLPSGPLSPDQPVPPEYDVFCETCGYSLIGLPSSRCPECGTEFDPAALPFARIPWLHRKRLGWVRAYVSTLKMILSGPERFATELCRPVRICADDALRFRRMTVALATVTTLLLAATLILFSWNVSRLSFGAIRPAQLAALICMTLIGTACFWLILYLATDMPTFIWRGLPGQRHNDLGPLHHYASAPLIFLTVHNLLAIAPACILISNRQYVSTAMVFTASGILLGLLLAVLLLYVPLVFMQIATRCTRRRCFALVFYLPVHWALCAALGFLMWLVACFAIGAAFHIR